MEDTIEESDEDQNFIDDSESASFFEESSFYTNIENSSLDNENSKDDSDWLIDKDSHVENYSFCGIINPDYDNFKNENERIEKFDSVCFSLEKTPKIHSIMLQFSHFQKK